MPNARKASEAEKKSVVVIATQKSASSSNDHRSLPTLLQWVKKQPMDRNESILYPVNLVFFAGAYPSHTLVTEIFRARLQQSQITYSGLCDVIQEVEKNNRQLYVKVSAGTSGDFELIAASDELQYTHTGLRWIGSDDPYVGVALEYNSF